MELNKSILDKMGWVPYSIYRGLGMDIDPKPFDDDPLVRYFIHVDHKPGHCYIIKELDKKEKQTSKNEYKFIEMNYIDNQDIRFEVFELSRNEELFKLIASFSCTNSEYYKRHFTLNKIIK
jgi:hypothetical protein